MVARAHDCIFLPRGLEASCNVLALVHPPTRIMKVIAPHCRCVRRPERAILGIMVSRWSCSSMQVTARRISFRTRGYHMCSVSICDVVSSLLYISGKIRSGILVCGMHLHVWSILFLKRYMILLFMPSVSNQSSVYACVPFQPALSSLVSHARYMLTCRVY